MEAERVIEGSLYANISSTTTINSGRGQLFGIFVASASGSPTIKVWDQTTAAAPILVNTFTPVAATYYPMPTRFLGGLTVTIGGTVDCTVFWMRE